MTKKPVRSQQARREALLPPIPHSSWSRPDRTRGRSVIIGPDDFWLRLGL
ncbi:hypothetical protein [Sphingobium sp.]